MWEEGVAAQLDGKKCSGIRLQGLGKSTQTLSHNTKTEGEIRTQALQSTNQTYYLHLTACSHVLSELKFAIYGHSVVLRCCVTYRELHRKCQECQWRVMIETQFQPDIFFFPGGREKKHETFCQDNKVPCRNANQYPYDTLPSVYVCV